MDRRIGRWLVLLLGSGWMVCAPGAWSQSADRVLAPVNASEVASLGGNRPGWAQPEADTGPVPGDMRLQHLTLLLARDSQTQHAFEQLLQSQQDPSSSDYHHWLTAPEIGERFGVSLHDIAAIKQWLQSHYLQVDSVSASRVRIEFSGTATAVGSAFGANLHYFATNGAKRISITAPPQVPAVLGPVIAGVHGLYSINYRPMHKSKVVHLAAPGIQPDLTVSPGQNYIVPGDFAVIYDVNPVYAANIKGQGQSIAIIGRSRVDNADIENFQSTVALAKKDPTVIIPPDGIDPGPPQTAPPPGIAGPSADQAEATLDVIRAGGTAPSATVDLVVSASTLTTDGVAIAARYVVDTTPAPASIMSLSFSACENEAGLEGVAFWDSIFSQAAAEGISVFVASGDSGAAGCEIPFQSPSTSQIVSTNALCSSSYATCVGGTEFADSSNPSQYWNPNATTYVSALSYIPEGAWNEPNSESGTQAASSGGGSSLYIPTPIWQRGPGVPSSLSGRYTPDVAFSASEHDGYFGCFAAGGGDCLTFFEIFYGTSAAAPSMAGIAALLNQKLGAAQGNLNPVLYRLAAAPSNNVFHDVTIASSSVANCFAYLPSMCNNSTPSPFAVTGGLSGYLVGNGYDEVTGWGSIDVANFIASWSAAGVNTASTTTTLTASANPVVVGSAITFTTTVTTSGSTAPTGTVNFLDGSVTIGSATLISGVATFTITTLSLGQHTIAAIYAGDASNPGSTSTAISEKVLASSPVPVLASIAPLSAFVGSGAFTLTLTGSNFLPTSKVLWNGSSRSTTYINSSELQAAILAADLANVGGISVVVSNPAPGGNSNLQNFDVFETLSGTGGYLSMFLSGANLGNSALYQNNNGWIGLGTTSPQSALHVTGGTQALSYQFSGNASPPTDATASFINQAFVGPTISGFGFSVRTGVNPAMALYVDWNHNLSVAGNTSALAYTFTGNAVPPTDPTATFFNQALVGPTISGLGFSVRTGPVPTNALTVDASQNVGIKGCLYALGGSVLTGTCSSDMRLKTAILPFAPVLDKLVKLQPVHFNWRSEEYPGYGLGLARSSGLIAQDVEKVFPEMVTTDARGFKMVNYGELPYLTLAAIRELKTENDALRGQLAAMQTRLARLEKSSSPRPRRKTAAKRKRPAVTKPE